MTHGPRIGVIADTMLQGHLLATALRGQGYEVVINTGPSNIDDQWVTTEELELWLVDLIQEDRWSEFLDDFVDRVPVPVLFSDGQAPPQNSPLYPRWERRLLSKLLDYVARPRLEKLENLLVDKGPLAPLPVPREFQGAHSLIPERVWVLGASLGGPAAVKVFLDRLPKEIPVAFILAQHIDQGFLDTLAGVLCRDNSFECRVGYDGEQLAYGRVLIAPVEYEIKFTETGKLQSTGKPWEGPYSPSIDQTIQNAMQRYRERCGVILFSGMGNDGSIAGPQLAQLGGKVWAQDSDSCACSSQPDSVRQTGCTTFSGTPEKLALALVEQVRQDIKRQSQG